MASVGGIGRSGRATGGETGVGGCRQKTTQNQHHKGCISLHVPYFARYFLGSVEHVTPKFQDNVPPTWKASVRNDDDDDDDDGSPLRKFQLRLSTTRLTRSPNDGGIKPVRRDT